MKECYAFYLFRTLALIVFVVLPRLSFGQLGVDMETTDNTNCNGAPCDYNGPSILINELMLSPTTNDGSMWGGSASQKGEWIELYNPNICESVDISCFYLGNNANDGAAYPGGYVIPPGTIVPAAGFALIRGVNAAAVPANRLVQNGGNVVELVVTGDGVCVGGGTRLWFPNSGGWFAFYDNNGIPQDAVSWTSASNVDKYPCTPDLSGCGFTGSLPNYEEFPADRKNYILSTDPSNSQGKSVRRIPDGGVWSGIGNPTYATCNSVCINPQNIVCNGTAIAEPHGGTPPYTYAWNDSKAQTSQTATQLCAGEFCVIITDVLGNIFEQCVTVDDVSYDLLISADICVGETYTLPNNTTVSESGEYPVLLHTGQGCDSLVTVSLVVHPNYSFELDPQICPGDIYTLPDGAEVSQTGTYYANFQTLAGCDSIYTVNLVVSNPINILVEAEICDGNTYELPDGSEVTNPGLYEVLMSGGVSCDTLYKINLDFYSGFQITADELNPITCFGEDDGNILLNIIGSTEPYTYTWSDGVDHGSQASSLEPGEYSVLVTDTHGCESEAEFEIVEPEPISISASANELICFGSPSELIASANGGTGLYTYQWSHTASNDANVTVNPQENTTYAVFAIDANNCESESFTLEVSVINMYSDSLDVSSSDSICIGDDTSVTATYNGDYPPYTYTWSHGLPTGPGPHSISPNETTVYTVTVQDDCGNEVTKNIPITIMSLPVGELATLTDISCFGLNDGVAQISVSEGTPGYSFTWSDGQDHGAIGQGLTAGMYQVNISDVYGCEDDISFEITEPEVLDITLSGDTLICVGSESDLVAQATGGVGSINYIWNHTVDNSGEISVSPSEDNSYSVYAQDANGCKTLSLEIDISVIDMYPGLLQVSGDTAICPGESVSIFGTYAGNYPPYGYAWSEGLGTGAGPHSVSPTETTTYAVTVSDACGNSLWANVLVSLFENPQVEIPNDLISGCSPLEFELFDPINTGSGFTHDWRFSNGTRKFGNPVDASLESPGIYEVRLFVTSPDGCTASSENTMVIEVYESPIADFSASRWSTGIDDPNIVFTNTGSGFTSSSWHIVNAIIEDQSQISYTFPDTGKYNIQLFLENEFGCRDSITKRVSIEVVYDIDIPNAFTPTGTGDNPNYDPTSTSNTVFYPFSKYVVEYEMNIFNRWGELIFESTEFQKGWNGTYRDKPCPQDVYVYKIVMMHADGNKVTKVGDVTLFR